MEVAAFHPPRLRGATRLCGPVPRLHRRASERFESVQRASGLEDLGVELEGERRRIAAGAAARALLAVPRMRRRIGAQKELGAARRRCGDERLAVLLALEYRQAVEMRPQSPG